MKIVTFLMSILGYPPEQTEAQVVAASLKKAALDLLAAKAEQEAVNSRVSALVARKARLEAEQRRLQAAARVQQANDLRAAAPGVLLP